MCTFYKRYLSLCADWEESPSGVADKLGIARSTVTKWKKGGNPTDGNLQRIASFFGVSMEWLRDGSEPKKDEPAKSTIPPGFIPLSKMVKRPLVGRIACGEPITAKQNIEKYVDVPEDVRCDFCLECDGDSMIDVGIHSGDVVYIRIQPEVENGEIAAADWWADYQNRIKPGTGKTYEAHYRRCLAAFSGRQMKEITPAGATYIKPAWMLEKSSVHAGFLVAMRTLKCP